MTERTLTLPNGKVLRRAFLSKYEREEELRKAKDLRQQGIGIGTIRSFEELSEIIARVRPLINRPVWLASEFYALVESPDAGDHIIKYRTLSHDFDRLVFSQKARMGDDSFEPPWKVRVKQIRVWPETVGWARRTAFHWKIPDMTLPWITLDLEPTKVAELFKREPPIPEVKDLPPISM